MSNDGTAPRYSEDADFSAYDKRIEKLVAWGNKNLNFEQAIRLFAIHRLATEVLSGSLSDATKGQEVLISQCDEQMSSRLESLDRLKDMAETLHVASETIPMAVQEGFKAAKKQAEVKASTRGKKAAEALHNKPGGAREKAEAIRAAWASGKYSNRDLCAEQECAHLGMSISTARKALRNTPDPA